MLYRCVFLCIGVFCVHLCVYACIFLKTVKILKKGSSPINLFICTRNFIFLPYCLQSYFFKDC